jgi:hypothetical protein
VNISPREATLVRYSAIAGGRWGLVVGAILGAYLAAEHYLILSTEVYAPGDTREVVTGVVVGVIGVTCGALIVSVLLERFGRVGVPVLILLSGVYGGALAFVVAGLCLTYLAPGIVPHPALTRSATVAAMAIGGLVGMLLFVTPILWWLAHLRKVLMAPIRESLDQANTALLGGAPGKLAGAALRYVEMRLVWAAARRVVQSIEHEPTRAALLPLVDGTARRFVIGVVAGIGVLGFVIGVGAGFLLRGPIVWTYALVVREWRVMLFPAATLGSCLGLLVATAYAAWGDKRTSGPPVTGALVGACGGVILGSNWNGPLSLLQTSVMHALIGLVLGSVLVGLYATMVGLLVGILRAQWASAARRRLAVWLQMAATALAGTGGLLIVGFVAVYLVAGVFIVILLPSKGPYRERVTVESNRGWQSANTPLSAGDEVSVTYLSGEWTIQKGRVVPSDASGGPAGSAAALSCACGQPLQGASRQALIGRIGNGPAFLIGDGAHMKAPSAGDLYLRMNDADANLRQHDGSIQVIVAVS